MKERLQTPRFVADSDRLLISVGQFAISEAHHIVPMDQIKAPVLRTSWDDLMFQWEFLDFGRIIREDDGYTTQTAFALNDQGLSEAKRLIARHERARWRQTIKRNVWPAFNAFGTLIAALAALAAAYFSYLGLQR